MSGMVRFKTAQPRTGGSTGYPWNDGDILFAADLNAAFLPITGGGIVDGPLSVNGLFTAGTSNFVTLDAGTLTVLGSLDVSGPFTTDSLTVSGTLTAGTASFTSAAAGTMEVSGTLGAVRSFLTNVTADTLDVTGNTVLHGATATTLGVTGTFNAGTGFFTTATTGTLEVSGTSDVNGKAILSGVLLAGSFPSDAAAGVGGVVVGQVYRNGSTLMVRTT